MPKIRTFRGNIPKDGKLVHSFDGWMLFERNVAAPYVNFKLVFNGRRAFKGNFWFAYYTTEKRFISHHDTVAMYEKERELFDTLLAWLRAHYPA